jgi:hypothetical protein
LDEQNRYFTSPENKLTIYGELRPKSRFLGNSAATIMEGASYAVFLDRPEDGEYHITMPNMFVSPSHAALTLLCELIE